MSKPRHESVHLSLPDGRTVAAEFDHEPVDLEAEVVLDSAGRRVDAAYVEQAVADVHAYLDAHPELRSAGRPSLSVPGQHSPHVAFRVPVELAEQLDALSAQRGLSRSALAREALAEYLRHAS